jgi:hypothetical protein
VDTLKHSISPRAPASRDIAIVALYGTGLAWVASSREGLDGERDKPREAKKGWEGARWRHA